MARYIDADEMEYTVLHLDVDVAEHKCKDYESYINGANQFRHQVKVALRHTPTADVEEVKHGKWVEIVKDIGRGRTITHYQCSLCGVYIAQRTNGCPNCIAKMDGGNEE